ncbi:MAG: hypothetical protein PVG65_00875 [Candidatus Thorarchaeota archaeon]|jgi:hypothetical protein
MPTAVIHNVLITDAFPQHMVALYSVPGIGAGEDSTSLIILELPGISNDLRSYLKMPRRGSAGKAYAIEMVSFQIACNSADFTVRVLNRNDITAIDSIYQVLKLDNVNKVEASGNANDKIIRNRDNPIDNKLYVHISNAGLVTGTIWIELIYYNIRSQID